VYRSYIVLFCIAWYFREAIWLGMYSLSDFLCIMGQHASARGD
jgi:hypothetical protein